MSDVKSLKNIKLEENATSDLLNIVLNVSSEMGIRVWLDQGTLLGIVREGKLISWDNDVDISSWSDDWSKENEKVFRSRLFSQGVDSVVIPRNGAISMTWQAKFRKRSSSRELPVNLVRYTRDNSQAVRLFAKPRLNFKSIVGKVLIAIPCRCLRFFIKIYTIVRPDPSVHARLVQKLENIHRVLWLYRDRYLRGSQLIEAKVPQCFFDNLLEIKLNSSRTLIPAKYEEYLTLKYGTDWMTPRQMWVTWEDDGAISNTNKV